MAVLGILLTTIAVTLLYGESTTKHWFIVPKGSSSECKHYTAGTRSTLQQLSNHFMGTKHTSITLTFLPGDHLLTWNMSISGAKEVILKSVQRHHPRIICLKDKGIIKISETKILTNERLHFHGCKGYGAIKLFTKTTPNTISTRPNYLLGPM